MNIIYRIGRDLIHSQASHNSHPVHCILQNTLCDSDSNVLTLGDASEEHPCCNMHSATHITKKHYDPAII